MHSLHIRSSEAGLLDNENTYYLLNACFTSLLISLNVSAIRIPAITKKKLNIPATLNLSRTIHVILIHHILTTVDDIVGGPFMMALLIGTGIYLTFRLRGVQARKFVYAFRLITKRKEEGRGDISPFRALMTSLSGTIGTGNIAGVATAISLGGPGALFWMWLTAIVGMATKFVEY